MRSWLYLLCDNTVTIIIVIIVIRTTFTRSKHALKPNVNVRDVNYNRKIPRLQLERTIEIIKKILTIHIKITDTLLFHFIININLKNQVN